MAKQFRSDYVLVKGLGLSVTRGHPIGVSVVRMIYEIVTQLRGQAAARQVKQAELGLVDNLGGRGAVACVLALGAA